MKDKENFYCAFYKNDKEVIPHLRGETEQDYQKRVQRANEAVERARERNWELMEAYSKFRNGTKLSDLEWEMIRPRKR